MKSSRQKTATATKNKKSLDEAKNDDFEGNSSEREQLSGSRINKNDHEDLLPQVVRFHNDIDFGSVFFLYLCV